MSMLPSVTRWRPRAIAAAAAAALAGLAGASAATAETLPVTCASLQKTVTSVGSAPGHGEGDTIVLSGMCNAALLGSSTGVTLPPGSAFTLKGADATAGIDGAAITGPLLAGEELGQIAIAGLTFKNATSSGVDGGAMSLRASRITLSGDSFIGDSHEGVAGGALFAFVGPPLTCPAVAGPPAVTITDSTFRNNTNTVGGGIGAGGAALVVDNCPGTSNVLERNVFEGNTLRAVGSTQVVGGALLFESESKPGPATIAQKGNVFADNAIADVAGTGSYGGGGEWLEGMSLTSVGDRFSANVIPGTSGPYWSWGAGIGLLACSNTEPTQSTLENAVVAGNSIVGGEAADLGGAGVYVGCVAKGTANQLTVLDSTITENTVAPGGVAGIDGGPHDQLTLLNSIVADGGSETGGFNGSGGSLVSAFSDVCGAGSAALAGEGNICAPPRLADAGNPNSFDVHETPSSPTIDAGSNALVPTSLASDFFGAPRIAAGTSVSTCGGAPTSTAKVDIGAAEAPPGTRALTIACAPAGPPVPTVSQLAFPAISDGAAGVLSLSFASLSAGRLSASATYQRTRTLVKRVHGRRRRVRRTETLRYGSASASLTASGSVRLVLRPSAAALKVLIHQRRLRVLLTITFTQPGRLPTTQRRTAIILYKAPPRHRRH